MTGPGWDDLPPQTRRSYIHGLRHRFATRGAGDPGPADAALPLAVRDGPRQPRRPAAARPGCARCGNPRGHWIHQIDQPEEPEDKALKPGPWTEPTLFGG